MSAIQQTAPSSSPGCAITAQLWAGTLHAFSEWPVAALSGRATGLYTVWDIASSAFLYVGVAGGTHAKANARTGLWRRLHQHASGDRSGDRFCIYVQDRLVLPTLTRADLERIARAEASLDQQVRDYVRTRLGFRFAETGSIAEARLIEERLKRGDWEAGVPLLNPVRRRTGRPLRSG